jgi:GntR family transcriptional regulator, transcriptional repressor for pyruvate dehydrogenase complex
LLYDFVMLSDNLTFERGLSKTATALAEHGVIPALNRPASLADEAYHRLLLQLDMNLWTVGAKLPTEKALGESLGVSRAVVREALARLRADGRIETRQGSGAFVADRTKIAAFRTERSASDIDPLQQELEILELRQIVEAGAAEIAATRRTKDDLKSIRAALEAMHGSLTQRTDGSMHDDAFHNAIASASHNSQIANFVQFLGAQFSDSRKATWDDIGYGIGIAAVGQSDHAAIYKAIEAQEGAKAKRLSHAHVQRAIDRVLLRIEQRDSAGKVARKSNGGRA